VTIGVGAALVARGVLSAVFGTSAWSKLRDRRATRELLRRAGLPVGIDLSLAVTEAFTAFGIMMERRSAWSVWVAIVLLCGFTGFVVRQIATGNDAPCPCFGSGAQARPTGYWTLARNVALLAIAAVSLGPTGRSQWVVWAIALAGIFGTNAVTAAAAKRVR
jgi:hypothetical protein